MNLTADLDQVHVKTEMLKAVLINDVTGDAKLLISIYAISLHVDRKVLMHLT